MKYPVLAMALALPFSVWANKEGAFSDGQPKTVLTEPDDFDRSTLLSPNFRGPSVSGLALLHPNRFSMQQSYSVGFSSSSYGSQSSGLYLNTLSYRLAEPLTLTADVGFHTPFHSSLSGVPSPSLRGSGMGSSLVLPHVGLEYRPSKLTTISLHLINGPDAARAYGYPFSPFWNPWDR